VSANEAALIAVVAVAPLAIVIIVALLKGYTLDVHLYRKKNGDE
jgi:hypothetical protein